MTQSDPCVEFEHFIFWCHLVAALSITLSKSTLLQMIYLNFRGSLVSLSNCPYLPPRKKADPAHFWFSLSAQTSVLHWVWMTY